MGIAGFATLASAQQPRRPRRRATRRFCNPSTTRSRSQKSYERPAGSVLPPPRTAFIRAASPEDRERVLGQIYFWTNFLCFGACATSFRSWAPGLIDFESVTSHLTSVSSLRLEVNPGPSPSRHLCFFTLYPRCLRSVSLLCCSRFSWRRILGERRRHPSRLRRVRCRRRALNRYA